MFNNSLSPPLPVLPVLDNDTAVFPFQTYVPTVFENYTACLETEEQRVELSLWDTSGEASLSFSIWLLLSSALQTHTRWRWLCCSEAACLGRGITRRSYWLGYRGCTSAQSP